jgi:hypothetical protein
VKEDFLFTEQEVEETQKLPKYLLQEFCETTRRIPLHERLEDLTWIGHPSTSDAPPLRYVLHRM